MGISLMTVFKNTELKKMGKSSASIVELAFKVTKKNGDKIARAVLDDGTTLIKNVSSSGIVADGIYSLPEMSTTEQRNRVIKDLAKKEFNQETIAVMLDISQSTVSNVLRK